MNFQTKFFFFEFDNSPHQEKKIFNFFFIFLGKKKKKEINKPNTPNLSKKNYKKLIVNSKISNIIY